MGSLRSGGNLIGSNVITGITGASSVAVGLGGEIYVVGSGSPATTGFGFLVVKHDASFHELWRSSYPGTGTAMQASLGSVDPDGNIASYAWDFGNGQTSTAANPSHTYAAGSYAARLTVTDNLSATSTSAPITITADAPPPAQPTSLTLAKSAVSGGSSTTATVTVSSAAGVTLALASSHTAVASVPATVVIPVGATRTTFTVRTSNVRRDTVVTLTATANGATATARLTVRAR